MGIAFSTAGMKVLYAMETTAGTRPTTGYKEIPDIKSTPDYNTEPNGIDVTTLSETVALQYVEGLRDYGSSLSFTANLTNELTTAWDAFCEAAETGEKTGLKPWIQIIHPKLTKAWFAPGSPVKMSMPTAETNAALETTVYIVPAGGGVWDTPSPEAEG